MTRNVDCEYIVPESHDCDHPKMCKGFIAKLWRPTCIEMKLEHVDCHFRESLWDMLKKDPAKFKGVTKRPGPPPPGAVPNRPNWPPAPPAPPPKRIYTNGKRVYNTNKK